MARGFFLALFFGAILWAQKPAPAPEEPPEEDESLAPKDYALNPVQSGRELTAGNFYLKKGNFRAAIRRYTEATRWDNGNAEAFLKLGEAAEKAKEYTVARDAYLKYVDLAKDPKEADPIRKRIAKLPNADASAKPRPQAEPTQPLEKVPSPDPAPSRQTPVRRR